jgi:chemotaxis protein CheX
MPQLGFANTRIGKLSVKSKEVVKTGVIVVIGIVGDMKGNAVYAIDIEDAKKIASTMMMGAPVDSFDDMAKSAISELTNMLTATAATFFSNSGITVEISTPTLLHGENMRANMNSEPILCVPLFGDEIVIELNISVDN